MLHAIRYAQRILRSPHTYAALTLVACLVFIGLGTRDRINDLGKPFGGFLFDWDGSTYRHTVNISTPFWWPGFQQTHLQPGDKLIMLNRTAYQQGAGELWLKAAQAPQPAELVVQRNGQMVTLPIHIISFNWSDWVDVEASLIIAVLCNMLLAVGVYTARPQDSFNRILAAIMFFLGMAARLTGQPLFGSADSATRITETAWIIIQPFLAALQVHLALLIAHQPEFQTNQPERPNQEVSARPLWFLRGVYALAICHAAASVGATFCIWGGCLNWPPSVIGPIDRILRDTRLLLGLLSGCFLLARIAWLALRHRVLPDMLQALGAAAIVSLVVLLPVLLNDLGLLGYRGWMSALASVHLGDFATQFAFAVTVFRNQKLRVGPGLFWLVMVISSSACISFVILITLHTQLGSEVMRLHAWLIFALVLVGLLVGVAWWGLAAANREQKLRQLPERILKARERERTSIRNELHDSTQGALTGLRLHLENLGRNASIPPNLLAQELRQLPDDLRLIELDLRRILQGLAPMPTDRGLIEPLRELCQNARKRTGLNLRTEFSSDIEEQLDEDRRFVLYRVIQESLTNIHKHANATEANVRIWLDVKAQQVCFEIQDNGLGFDPALPQHNRFGLASIKDRLAAYEGELRIQTSPGAGTLIAGALPSH